MPLEGDALAAWLNERAGKLTASRMSAALGKDGPKAKLKLMHEILAERMTGDTVRHFVTDAMQWGLEKECDAKAAYEAETGIIVRDATFYNHPRIEYFGATPDGLIGHEGLIETKCPTTPVFVEWKLAGAVPAKYKPQMLAQLACTGRQWCEFVAYDPRVKKGGLFIRRFIPPREEVAAIEKAAEEFLAEIDAMWEVLQSAAA